MIRLEGSDKGVEGGRDGEGERGGQKRRSTTNALFQGKTGNKDKIEKFFIMSFNVRGINSPYKWSKILDFLRRKNVDIAFLQETHLKPNDVSKMQNHFYKPVVAATDGTRTKGTMIVVV